MDKVTNTTVSGAAKEITDSGTAASRELRRVANAPGKSEVPQECIRWFPNLCCELRTSRSEAGQVTVRDWSRAGSWRQQSHRREDHQVGEALKEIQQGVNPRGWEEEGGKEPVWNVQGEFQSTAGDTAWRQGEDQWR